jgi:hypothetical protein
MDAASHDDLMRRRTIMAQPTWPSSATALNLIHAIKGKVSLKIRRKTVGWDDDNVSQLARFQGATSSRPFIPGWKRQT